MAWTIAPAIVLAGIIIFGLNTGTKLLIDQLTQIE